MELEYFKPEPELERCRQRLQEQEARRRLVGADESKRAAAEAAVSEARRQLEAARAAARKGKVTLVRGRTDVVIPAKEEARSFCFLIRVFGDGREAKDDVLLCSASSAEARRDWIQRIRARVVDEDSEFTQVSLTPEAVKELLAEKLKRENTLKEAFFKVLGGR
jgi:small-conductance mechanosensitive channel